VSTHFQTPAAGGIESLTPRQRRILEAAADVFAERGFEGATTAVIAQRAGVAEGTIFKRFRTKRDLLLAVVGPYLLEVGAVGLRPILESALRDGSASLEEFLQAVVTDRLEFARAHPEMIRILVQESPFHPEVLGSLSGFGSTFLRVVERFQRSGQVDPALPPATVARIVLSTTVGHLLAQVFVLLRDVDEESAIEHTVRVLVRGLAPPEDHR